MTEQKLRATAQPIRVVAVEDERLVARDLQLRLKQLGYEVPALADSAEEALIAVNDHRPNVVLMDIRIKGARDGIDAARAIRERFDIPVVFVTAHADAETLARAALTDPFGYILKPFDDRELKVAIEMALYKHGTEKRLRESQDLLERAQRIAQLGNWEQNLRTGQFEASEAACLILGVPQGEPHTLESLLTRVCGDDRDAVRQAFRESASDGKPLRIEHRVMCPDGKERHVRQYGEVVVELPGTDVRLLGAVQDITDYKNLEERFRRSQKLEAIARLAGGVAHDFNNLLVVIKGYSDMILSEVREDDPLHLRAYEILKAGDRATSLTRQLLAFSRRQVMRPQVIEPNRLVADLENMLRRLVPETIQLRTVLDPKVHSIKADPGQIEQVVMNLVVNARDAMPKGGTLAIATSNAEMTANEPPGSPDLAPGRYTVITVTDTGTGIPPEVKSRLFEPFFTTKPLGEGTGLGLSTVYGIVKQHHGDIAVYTEVGRGSVFKVYLPATENDAAPAAIVVAPRVTYEGKETVLLVEDDDSVRTIATRMLESHGYTVLAAMDGSEAVALFEQRGSEIDMLLTDVVMPNMGGLELAQTIAARRPGLKTVFMSGYPGREISEQGVSADAGLFLQKPFTMDELGQRVREALDARASS